MNTVVFVRIGPRRYAMDCPLHGQADLTLEDRETKKDLHCPDCRRDARKKKRSKS